MLVLKEFIGKKINHFIFFWHPDALKINCYWILYTFLLSLLWFTLITNTHFLGFFFFFFSIFHQWLAVFSHHRQLLARRELGLGFISCLLCVTIRESGKLLALVLKYCEVIQWGWRSLTKGLYNPLSLESTTWCSQQLWAQNNSQLNQTEIQKEQWEPAVCSPLEVVLRKGTFCYRDSSF